MPSVLELCEKYFDTKDLYELFGIQKSAGEKEVKKAYYKLSLKCHPDRVPEQEKKESTEKFKLLTKLYNVMTDDGKRTLYDEKGIIDDDDESNSLSDWIKLWNSIFKPISTQDIENYEKSYRHSEQEATDIKKSYIQGKGCINHMMNTVPFLRVEDEPRLQVIVKGMIDASEVDDYPIFTNEPTAKRNRRHKKYKIEAKLAEKEKEKHKDLLEQLNQNQLRRADQAESLFANIISKYGNEDDDSEIFDFDALDKKTSKRKTSKKSTSADKLHSPKTGRVTRPKRK